MATQDDRIPSPAKRRSDPGPEQTTLFYLSAHAGTERSDGEERQRAVPTVAWATCPMHVGTGKQTGLQYSNDNKARHLVWRQHTYVTWGGAPAVCRASGVSICVARPAAKPGKEGEPPMMRVKLTQHQAREDKGERVAKCPHEKAIGIDWGTSS